MKKIFACIISLFLSSIVFAQELQPKLEKAEAIAIAKAVSLEDDVKALDSLLSFGKGKELSPAYLYNIAIMHANLGNLEEAISFYSKAIKAFDSFYLAHKNIAFSYANLANYELALEHISKASALGGLDLQMYMCIATANISLNNFSEALFALRNAQMLSPNKEAINDNILYCLSKLEMWQDLQFASEKILAKNQKSQKAWRALVLAQLSLNKEEEAITSIEAMNLLGLAENNDLVLLANTYFNKEIYARAIPLYLGLKEYLDDEKLSKIANALVDVSEIDTALELAPQNDFGNFAKARAYKAKNDLEQAEEYAKESLKQNPLSKKAMMFLAQLYIDKGDYALAKISLNRLKSDSDYAYRAKYLLSHIAIKEQDYELALSLLRQIRNSSNFEYIDSYIKKLEKVGNA